MTASRPHDDDGSVMPMTAILIGFLMIGGWALISGSQQWSARRDAYATAAAAARAGAQGDTTALRNGEVFEPGTAVSRAEAILAASGHGGVVTVDGTSVRVVVTVGVRYAFPAPGFPASVTGTAAAVAQRGVNGTEGG
jgi:Flp pilus assembly protein TadG